MPLPSSISENFTSSSPWLLPLLSLTVSFINYFFSKFCANSQYMLVELPVENRWAA